MFPVQPILVGKSSRPLVSISNQDDSSEFGAIEEIVTDPADTDLRYSLFLTGIAYRYVGGVNNAIANEWLLSGNNSDYEVRATEISKTGTATETGTLNTWMVLSSDRTWRATKSSGTGAHEWELLIEIRLASTGQVLDSAHIILRGEIEL